MCIRKEMPRPRCPRCGAPSEGGFFRTKCEYCGARLGRSTPLWRAVWKAIVPFVLFIGFAAVAIRGNFFNAPYMVIVEIIYCAVAIVVVFVLQNFSVPEHAPRILDFLKTDAPASAPVQYRAPDKPSFDTPRSWGSILAAARPRSLRWTLSGKIGFAIIPVWLGLGVWVLISAASNPRRTDRLWSFTYAGFFSLLLIFGFIKAIRTAGRSWMLMRDGEVTVGWIADVWETGGRHSRVHITVGFRDSVGRLFEQEFVARRVDESIDQGRPVLVFYDPLNPERCITPSATWIELGEMVESVNVVRAG